MSAARKRLLVTGGMGFLGRHVLQRALAEGHAVRAIVRPGTEAALKDLSSAGSDGRLEVCPTRLDERDGLSDALGGVDAVLHLAAAKVGSAAAQVAGTVLSSECLFGASVDAGVERFVLVSSLGVMGASAVAGGRVVDEDTPLEPHPERRDPYTFAKLRQEQLAWRYHQERGLPLVVLRPGVIFGERQNLLSARVGLSLFGVFLHLGGGNKVPLTYVENCAEAILRAAHAPGVEGRAFCVVDDDLPSSRQVLRRYRREVERVRAVPVPFPLLRVLAVFNTWYSRRTDGHLPPVFTPYKVDAMWRGHGFSNTRAKAELGWSPRVPMEQALERSFGHQATRG